MKYDHLVPSGQRHFVWDNSIRPVLRVRSQETVLFEVTDASGGQLSAKSTSNDVLNLDFSRVNPVTGPVYVEEAQPGDVLEVEIQGFSAPYWGWTAVIPGFGLLAEQFSKPLIKHWFLEGKTSAEFGPGIRIPLQPMVGTAGVAPAKPGKHSIVPPAQNGGNMDFRHLTLERSCSYPFGWRGRCSLLVTLTQPKPMVKYAAPVLKRR